MPRAPKLKVYRTPIGFHDAYVAAPSQKAALEAWGTATNLFARGAAELVTEQALTREPLAHPGKVIRRSRGSIDEQLAALPPDPPKASNVGEAPSGPSPRRRAGGTIKHPSKAIPPRKPKPRPSRVKLDRAEQRLTDLLAEQQLEITDLREREKALRRERRDLERRQDQARQKAEERAEAERRAHAEALSRWRTGQ